MLFGARPGGFAHFGEKFTDAVGDCGVAFGFTGGSRVRWHLGSAAVRPAGGLAAGGVFAGGEELRAA